MRQLVCGLVVFGCLSLVASDSYAQSGRAKKPIKATPAKQAVADPDEIVTQQGTKLRKVEPKLLKETPATEDGEKYLLRYRFEPGLVLRSEVTHLSKNITRINSVLQDASSRTITDKAWQVLEADANSTTFEYIVEAIDLSQQFGSAEEIRYNTKEPAEQVPVQFAGALDTVGKVVSTIRIDARGMVVARSDSKDPPHMGMGDIT
ncbi:MAG: hypothetical protein LW850_13700, partial [Planctomycetaceae bacterium]|nr:hypothetical protein [Planctomycetaceae bacterium]